MASAKEKKEFIKWFVNNYQLKRRECKWILDYISTDDQLLNSLHFAEEIKDVSKGMIISTHCSNEVPFSFQKGEVKSNDAEKAFHDIRLNKDEKFYIQLNFSNKNKQINYLNILAETPSQENGESKYSKQAEYFLDYCVAEFSRNLIQKKIDQAIDDNDRDLFMALTKELNELPKPIKHFETVKSKELQIN